MNRLRTLIADNQDERSVSARLRRQRFALFQTLIQDLAPPVHILDLGGAQRYWEVVGFLPTPDIRITLLNIVPPNVTRHHFESLVGDARRLPQFADNHFDVVFSNSVIEHVGSLENQQAMGREVRRLAPRYYVQTPNRHFPIEPHFLFPFYQYLPVATRVWLLQRFRLGWMPRTPSLAEARQEVESIRLLNRREFAAIFPDATLVAEKFLGLTKSFVAYRGPTVSS